MIHAKDSQRDIERNHMSKVNEIDLRKLGNQISRLRGEKSVQPDISIVIPVNAQGDLKNVLKVLSDIAEYTGTYILEVILVINNYFLH